MRFSPAATLLCLCLPALAQDPAAGEAIFQKCKPCHAIIAPDGHAVKPGGQIGPNLYGIIGRPVASVAGFDYSPALQAIGTTGAVWDQSAVAAFLPDPTAWLQKQTGDPAAHSRMGLHLGSGAQDVAAWLATVK